MADGGTGEQHHNIYWQPVPAEHLPVPQPQRRRRSKAQVVALAVAGLLIVARLAAHLLPETAYEAVVGFDYIVLIGVCAWIATLLHDSLGKLEPTGLDPEDPLRPAREHLDSIRTYAVAAVAVALVLAVLSLARYRNTGASDTLTAAAIGLGIVIVEFPQMLTMWRYMTSTWTDSVRVDAQVVSARGWGKETVRLKVVLEAADEPSRRWECHLRAPDEPSTPTEGGHLPAILLVGRDRLGLTFHAAAFPGVVTRARPSSDAHDRTAGDRAPEPVTAPDPAAITRAQQQGHRMYSQAVVAGVLVTGFFIVVAGIALGHRLSQALKRRCAFRAP